MTRRSSPRRLIPEIDKNNDDTKSYSKGNREWYGGGGADKYDDNPEKQRGNSGGADNYSKSEFDFVANPNPEKQRGVRWLCR